MKDNTPKITSPPFNNEPTPSNHTKFSTEDSNLLSKKRNLFRVTKGDNDPMNLSTKQFKSQSSLSTLKIQSKTESMSSPKNIPLLSMEDLDLKYNALLDITKKDNEISLVRQDYLSHLKELDQRKRRILLDWLMEVCYVFNFQRETYHSAAVILDIYLSTLPSVPITHFQLIGITCLFISAKNEEMLIPTTSNFAKTTNYTFITNDILEMEMMIMQTLKWKIQYPNMAIWMNYLMLQWDNFTKESQSKMPQFERYEHMTKVSYWLIDTISLDYEHLAKNMKILTCVVLYIVIGIQLGCFTIDEVKETFALNENHIENYPQFNLFFNAFLMKELGVELSQFREHFSYVCCFMSYCDMIEGERRSDDIDIRKLYCIGNFVIPKETTLRLYRNIQDYGKSKSLVAQLIEEKRHLNN